MSLIDRFFRRGLLWSFAIYATDGPFTPSLKLGQPVKLFNSKRLRLFGSHPHTQADPFLLVDGGTLYIFYERVDRGSVGRIACVRTADLETLEDCGIVLAEPHHLSWPFVFRAADNVYLVPESSASGRVTLYRFEAIPSPLVAVRTLLEGQYTDPVLIDHEGRWYLFATSAEGLELFIAPDLLSGKFERHPASPVSTDPRYWRSGGPPMRLGGNWVRVAQDGSRRYGENVSLIEITRLTPHEYEEHVLVPEFFKNRSFWNRDGAHHLSVTEFKGKTVIAADGRHRDYWINKLLPMPRNRRSKDIADE